MQNQNETGNVPGTAVVIQLKSQPKPVQYLIDPKTINTFDQVLIMGKERKAKFFEFVTIDHARVLANIDAIATLNILSDETFSSIDDLEARVNIYFKSKGKFTFEVGCDDDNFEMYDHFCQFIGDCKHYKFLDLVNQEIYIDCRDVELLEFDNIRLQHFEELLAEENSN